MSEGTSDDDTGFTWPDGTPVTSRDMFIGDMADHLADAPSDDEVREAIEEALAIRRQRRNRQWRST